MHWVPGVVHKQAQECVNDGQWDADVQKACISKQADRALVD